MGCGASQTRRRASDGKSGTADEQAGKYMRNELPKLTQPLSPKSHGSGATEQIISVPLDPERVLADVSAKKVSVEEFKAHLKGFVPSGHPQAESLSKTLLGCVELLAGGVGGVILAIVEKKLVQDLQFSYLDTGLLMNLCRQVCPNVQQDGENFKAVLHHFCMHSETDRWSQHELEGLAAQLPEGTADILAPLEDNPKDGAFILSQSGTVVAAAGHLKYSSKIYQLVRADGHSCGTRHAAALALAEWLGTSNSLGAVFVRSDGGGVHAMLPSGGDEPPVVMHFDSLRDLSQEDMLKHFRARIMEQGKLMHKVKEAMIRKATKGERVVTCVHGRVISETDVKDDNSMVIQADTFSKELYVLPRAKFEKNWEPIAEESGESCNGFSRHRPKKGIKRWIYKITAADVELCPTGWFKAAWGAAQPMREGDFLAMPAPEEKATEIYLMDADAVSCYAVAGDVEEEPKIRHLSQQEMLSTFKARIMRQGRLMQKVEPCMARQARQGERVVTCVQGRVISDVTVQDDTSMVLRAPTMDQELYVLQQAKFQANWLAEPKELDKADAVKKLLAVQGFKLYYPKPNPKWVYDVTAEDTKEVPTGFFYSSWGALQPIQAGDFLTLPAPEDRAKEVYLMPKEVVFSLQEVQGEPEAAPGPEPPAAPDAQQRPCSQEEMVELFEKRIRGQGRAVVKVKPGMIRPGRRGDHVVTYVNGRVLSETVVEDDTSMVVRAPTVDQEEYVLPREKFEANWEPEGEPLDEQDPVLAKLGERGFRLHRPKPNQKWVYRLEAADLELVPARSFEASWGSVQPLRAGDFLALAPSAKGDGRPEVYLMPSEVLDCYTDVAEVLSPKSNGKGAKEIADSSSASTIAQLE